MFEKIASLVVSLALAACSHADSGPARGPAGSPTPAELDERFVDATALVNAFRQRVPPEIVQRTRCLVVVPGLISGGLIVGARHGSGLATCRAENGWSAPAPLTISGASLGPQIGVESVDLIMLVVSDEGLRKILRAKLALGADMSVSAGPVGKGKEIATDTSLKAEALSYTSSRGLFAGVDLNGASIDQDFAATASLYGRAPGFPQLLTGAAPAPARASPFLTAVAETFNERVSATDSP